MPASTGRFSRLRRLQGAVCVLGLLGALAVIATGLLGAFEASTFERTLLIVLGGMFAILVVMVWTFAALTLKLESTATRELEELRDLTSLVGGNAERLREIAHSTSISDAAKSLAHREAELDMLRAAIREDIRVEKWDLASMLIEALERRFNAPEEAKMLREQLNEHRRWAISAKLKAAIVLIDGYFSERDWTRARAQIQRLVQLFPQDERVTRLSDRLRELQLQHKEQLLKEWEETVKRNDTDRAIDLLKELDQYLTPEEAKGLHDKARHVFKEKLFQLGAQFRFAVNEKRWQDALDTGLELVREFPNARMSDEVRNTIDILRERARQVTEAATS